MSLLTRIPMYGDRLRSYGKHGPRYFLMAIFARFMLFRSFMAWQHRRKVPQLSSGSGPTLVEQLDVEEAVLKIRQDGFYSGLRLRRQAREELLSFCSTAPCFGDGKPDRVIWCDDKGMAQQQAAWSCRRGIYPHPLRSSSQLRALASDTQLLAIARRYLGTEPVLVGAGIWWSFPGPADGEQRKDAAQVFHYDIDGYGAVAFFFYLTDVGPSSGPHVYVRGTHLKKHWRHTFCIAKRCTDADADKCYGPERAVVLRGPAGYGFAEDIFGFHKGLHPESGPRLIVQIGYSLHDYGTSGMPDASETDES